RQTRKRYRTEKEARKALADITATVARGTYVAPSVLTVDQACAEWLAGKRVRPTTLTAYTHSLLPLRTRHGDLPVQKLTKKHLDDLVNDLVAGAVMKSGERNRRPWGPQTVNPMLNHIESVLGGLVGQGLLARNVAALVDRLPGTKKEMQTYTEAEVRRLLSAADNDRNGHAWHLALAGLRRGEIGGLRWSDVDFEHGTLRIRNNRVSANGKPLEGDPKSARSIRVLPMTDSIKGALKRARRIQAEEKVALGEAYGPGTHVVCDPAGQPYHPDTLTDYWEKMCATAGVRRIRLHDARHTCGTLMHLQGVPTAVIAAWLGHADNAFTMRTYVHSQDDALAGAASALQAVVTNRDNTASKRPNRKRRPTRKKAG
ncbi:site-specific integrase, partial [Nocardia paucivorans]|uniref:site-specific integrase n=1 Tax=Nocardia paucivorans TaxID=114259 RepID=UPI000683F4DA